MSLGIGVTISANLSKLEDSINKYAHMYNTELGKLIRYVSLGLTFDIANANPKDTGRSRAGWLPALWANNVSVSYEYDTTVGHKPGEIAEAKREGVSACRFKYAFSNTMKPFFWVQNNVGYVLFLEYGVRKGAEKDKPIEQAYLASVSERSTKGFVRINIIQWNRKLKHAIRTGTYKGAA